jgi:hypothetical protein
MRGWIIIVVFFGGIFALCWYGATGETGPMGWLNSWQAGHFGSYSRGVSFAILGFAGALVATPTLAILAAARKKRAGSGPTPASITAPADAKVASMQAVMLDSSRWRLRSVLTLWLTVVVLLWGVVLAWHAWDFYRRSSDAGSVYTPLRLARDTPVARPGDGSHLALQGRLLWDRSVTRKTTTDQREVEEVFVPMAGADWRAGDAVQFVVQLERSGVWALQNRQDGADAPLLVRVEGAIPTPSRAVFQRAEAPPTDDAVLVEVVASTAGQVTDARPAFDWEQAKLIGLALSGIWTAGLGIGVPARLLKDRLQRRREAKQRPA